MQDIYKFNKGDFDDEGMNVNNGQYFMTFIDERQKDFHKKYYPYIPNYLFANNSTMILMKKAIEPESIYDYGMDLIDEDIDLETNLAIEKHSNRKTVYGLGSAIDDDEPLLLVIDDKISDGLIILKYIPDRDADDYEPKVPIEGDLIKTNG